MELHEINVTQLAPSSFRNTLKLLPVGKKGKQKFVYGDDTGCISCYEMKRGEAQLIFKTQGEAASSPIHVLAMSGLSTSSSDIIIKRDRIFAAQGQRISGISKAGKECFRLTSSLMEDIHYMRIEGTKIWTGCQYVYNLYDDGKDIGFFMCDDRINALELLPTYAEEGGKGGEESYDAVLGCQDKCIRVIHGSKMIGQVTIDGPVTDLIRYTDAEADGISSGSRRRKKGGGEGTGYVYGTEGGQIGWLDLMKKKEGEEKDGVVGKKGWILPNHRKLGMVNALAVLYMEGEGKGQVVVGRDDGFLQVYSIGEVEGQEPPILNFECNVGESIRSIACGIVNTPGYIEIILACYSGRIVSFTTESLQDKALDDQRGRSLGAVINENQINALRREIEELSTRVKLEKSKAVASSSNSSQKGGDRRSSSAAATDTNSSSSSQQQQQIQVISNLVLDPEEAAYRLVFEAPLPIELVCLKSTMRLELLDTSGEGEEGGLGKGPALSNTPITTLMQPALCKEGGAVLMATFKPPEHTLKRMVIKARTTEGEYGEVIATIVVDRGGGAGGKVAQQIRLRIKALSLHQWVKELSMEEEARPKNVLTLQGPFSTSLMHEWISFVLPEVPPRLPFSNEGSSASSSISLSFRNVYTHSVFSCVYSKGQATISSDSISSIAIFKEVVSRKAAARRIQINESIKLREETISIFLGLVQPLLKRQAAIAHQVGLIEAIKEVQIQEEGTAHQWLSPTYQEILGKAEYLRQEVKKRPRALEYLCGIITDLYVDLFKFKHGEDVRNDIPRLQRLVMAYDVPGLFEFFGCSSSTTAGDVGEGEGSRSRRRGSSSLSSSISSSSLSSSTPWRIEEKLAP